MCASVVLALYNGREYVEKQLDSIRLQSVPPCEVLLFDDGSTDGTPQVVADYISRHHLQESWKLFQNPENLGYADNFHQASGKARGDILFFSDQDDIWHLQKIETTLRLFAENPKIQVLCSAFQNFHASPGDTAGPKPGMRFASGKNPLGVPFQDGRYPHEENPCDATDPSQRENPCKTTAPHHGEATASARRIPFSRRSLYLGYPGCAMAVRRSFLKGIESYWYPGFAHDEFLWKMGLCRRGLYETDALLLYRRCHGKNLSFRKMRTLEERLAYLDNLEKSYLAMCRCLEKRKGGNERVLRFLRHCLRGLELRKKVLLDKKVFLLPFLFLYADTVKTVRTFFIEAAIGLRGK